MARQTLLILVTIAALAAALNASPTDSPSPPQQTDSNMSLVQAAVLGVVEGVTEYLPVSSTGHLLVTQQAMGIGIDFDAPKDEQEKLKQAADAYAICIQAGAIVAVLGLYFGRVKQMTLGLAGKDPAGFKLALAMLAGFIPAAVIGLALNDKIKEHLFGPWPVVTAWAVGGAAILAVAYFKREQSEEGRRGKSLEQLTWQMAMIIGFAQCIAMWPGVSRSLITIVGGVMVGLSLSAAVEFSFLLGLITLGAATLYDGYKHGAIMAEMYEPASLIVGFIFAFISAVLAVKWMVNYLKSHGLQVFGYYRIAIAIIVAALLYWKII